MAGGTGNLSDPYGFPGGLVKKWKAASAAFKGKSQVHNFAHRMRGNQRNFIFCRTLLRMAGGTHGIHETVTPAEPPRPEFELIFSVMDEMTNTAGARFRRSLTDDIFRGRRCYGKIVIGLFDIGLIGMTVIAKLGGR
jgi:hypothetical protein